MNKSDEKLKELAKQFEEMANEFEVINKVAAEFGVKIEELADILQDYAALAKEHRAMVEHFHHEAKPKRLADGTWVCPECGAKTPFNHSYCHKCGKRLSWYRK